MISAKGLTQGFGPKLAIFPFSFLGIRGQENVFYDILERRNGFLGYKKSELKKWKNWDFCKGVNPWFWSKIGHFSIFLFLSLIGQENVFYDILERKKAFLNYKNSIFKKWKNCDICKGVNPWFLSKIGYFSIFLFLSILGQENVFFDILERKNGLLGFKNKKFKKSRNWDICKGVNPWFRSKLAFFPSFVF